MNNLDNEIDNLPNKKCEYKMKNKLLKLTIY